MKVYIYDYEVIKKLDVPEEIKKHIIFSLNLGHFISIREGRKTCKIIILKEKSIRVLLHELLHSIIESLPKENVRRVLHAFIDTYIW